MLNNRTSWGDAAALKSAVSQKTAANHTRLFSTWNVSAPKDRIFKVTVILIQVVTQGRWPACWTEHSFPLAVAALWRMMQGSRETKAGRRLRKQDKNADQGLQTVFSKGWATKCSRFCISCGLCYSYSSVRLTYKWTSTSVFNRTLFMG